MPQGVAKRWAISRVVRDRTRSRLPPRSNSFDDGKYQIRYPSLPAFFEYLTDLFQKHPQLKSPPANQTSSTEICVARTEVPRESVLDPISLEEWTAFVESDPELELRGFEKRTNPFTKEPIRSDEPGLAVLTVDDSEQTFSYRYGRITVREPSPEAILKLRQVAEAFNARVIES